MLIAVMLGVLSVLLKLSLIVSMFESAKLAMGATKSCRILTK
jgi:hypothetical protein